MRPISFGKERSYRRVAVTMRIVVTLLLACVAIVWAHRHLSRALIGFSSWENADDERPAERAAKQGALDLAAASTADLAVITPDDQRAATDIQQALDPAADGWQTEAVAAGADGQLRRLAQLVENAADRDKASLTRSLTALVSSDFACQQLIPTDLTDGFSSQTVSTNRWVGRPDRPDPWRHRGPAGLATELQQVRRSLQGGSRVQIRFKQYRVSQEADSFRTLVMYEGMGRGPEATTQQNAVWQCDWQFEAAEELPTLSRIAVLEFEQVEYLGAGGTLFADVTAPVLGSNACYAAQLMPSIDYWRERIPRHFFIPTFGHQGLALGDVNGDGLDDLYVCQPGGLPNRLFLQRPDGTLQDSSATSYADILNYSRSALIVDLDNDGHQDLAVATLRGLWLLRGNGTGVFEPRALLSEVAGGYSLSAADYNSDGFLDLYVCVYYSAADNAGEVPFPLPYHDANNGGRNVLVQNNGKWRFRDVTDEAGLDEDNRRYSFAAAWEDLDNDGDLDLYVANDFGRNCLYENDRGRFRNVAAARGIEDTAFGMSVSFGDYDRDGWMDTYVGNMFSAAGNRVAFQPQFQSAAAETARTLLQRTAQGNSLFRNQTDGTFADVSLPSGASMGRWSWASLFADINNDGWPDLLVANGYVTGEKPADL